MTASPATGWSAPVTLTPVRVRTITSTPAVRWMPGVAPVRDAEVEDSVRRMLLAVAMGAVGMMVVARLATVLTLAPAGFPEPWELGGPPAAVAPAAAPAVRPAAPRCGPAVAAVVNAASGLSAPAARGRPTPDRRRPRRPRVRPRLPRRGRARPPRGRLAGPLRRRPPRPPRRSPRTPRTGAGSGDTAAKSSAAFVGNFRRSSDPSLARVCLKPVLGGCLSWAEAVPGAHGLRRCAPRRRGAGGPVPGRESPRLGPMDTDATELIGLGIARPPARRWRCAFSPPGPPTGRGVRDADAARRRRAGRPAPRHGPPCPARRRGPPRAGGRRRG